MLSWVNPPPHQTCLWIHAVTCKPESCFSSVGSKEKPTRARTDPTLLSGPWARHWTFLIDTVCVETGCARCGQFYFPRRTLRLRHEPWGGWAGNPASSPRITNPLSPSHEKTGQIFYREIHVGLFHMHVITIHPLNSPLFSLFCYTLCFLCAVFHFYKPLYWCLDEQYTLHTSTLIYLHMKLCFYRCASLKKGLLCLVFNLKSLQCLRAEEFLNI